MPLPNPLVSASLLSSATLHYGLSFVGSIFSRGSAVSPSDFWALPPFEASSALLATISAAWAAERGARPASPSLFRAYWSVFGVRYMLHSSVLLIKSISFFAMTVFLQALLEGLQDGSASAQTLYLNALGFVLCAAGAAMLHHSYFWLAWRAGQQWRTAALGLIFQKTLRLRLDALGAVSVGGLVSLASNDLERTTKLCQMLAYLVVGPLEACVILYLLLRVVGIAALAGYACMALLVLWAGLAGKLFGRRREVTARLSDTRLHLTAQVVSGARVLKAFGWEAAFAAEVRGVRAQELRALWSTAGLRAVNEGLFNVAPVIMGAVTFLTAHYSTNRVLRPSDVFVALTLLQFLQAEMCAFFPRAIESIAETGVLLRRLQVFLELAEAPPLQLAAAAGAAQGAPALRVQGLTTAWPSAAASPFAAPPPAPTPALTSVCVREEGDGVAAAAAAKPYAISGVSLEVHPGQLCGVCGPVGCGKTTLLLRILQEVGGEVNETRAGTGSAGGSVCVRGAVSYAAQTPWIQTGSIRDNILLGGGGAVGVDEARYALVLQACCLVEDCAAWPEGDATIVGEKGVTLSGGQKARIGLARALYKVADLYLLDDPLSAVDARVGCLLFTRAIKGLCAGSAVVLVTHQTHFLRGADRVLVLQRDGRPLVEGPWAELVGAQAHGELERGGGGGETLTALLTEPTAELAAAEAVGEAAAGAAPGAAVAAAPIPSPTPAPSEMSKEASASGTVSWGIYAKYAAAAGPPALLLGLLALLAAGTVITTYSSVALAQWTAAAAVSLPSTSSSTAFSPADASGGLLYGLLALAALILSIFRPLAWYRLSLTASTRLHNAAFSRIISAPTAFFDTNPTGRILNRFSKDLSVLDDALPLAFFDFVNIFLACVGILALVAAVNPWLLLLIAPLTLLFSALRNTYTAVSRVVKRLEAVSRSHIFSLLAECTGGLPSVRAFDLTPLLLARFYAAADENGRAYWAWLATTRWLGLRLDMLCLTLLAVTTMSGVALRSAIPASLIGLLLSQIIAVTNAFQWAVRQSSEVENAMVACERVCEYAELEPVEVVDLGETAEGSCVSAGSGEGGVPSTWPEAGALTLDNVYMRYRAELPYSLKGMCASVKGGQRVGIVGRTGSGKSSLLAAVLRLTEPTSGPGCGAALRSGVVLDGWDTRSIPLTRLRRAIGMIPQDPHLTEGTVRKNLDPFGVYTDAQCWEALEAVQLKGLLVGSGSGSGSGSEGSGGAGLSFAVEEGGGNLSVGQRQLLCLARAALRRCRLLLIDEATANVDADTQRLVSSTLRTAFPRCTIVAVAHRLETVIDFEEIWCVSEGMIVEQGCPHELLGVEGGTFAGLVESTGPVAAGALRAAARAAWEARQQGV